MGTVAGYFCHRVGPCDTERATLASQRSGDRLPRLFGLGNPLTLKVGCAIGQFGVGSVTAGGLFETIWCETIDWRARNMIKSDEHRFASSFAGCHRRFALKGKDFS